MRCNWVRASIGYRQRLGGGYGRFRQRTWPATGLDWRSRQRDASGLGFLSPRLEAEGYHRLMRWGRLCFPNLLGFLMKLSTGVWIWMEHLLVLKVKVSSAIVCLAALSWHGQSRFLNCSIAHMLTQGVSLQSYSCHILCVHVTECS